MITYNDIYEALRKERYSEQLQNLGKNFVKAIDIRTKQAVGKDYVIKNGDGLEIMVK